MFSNVTDIKRNSMVQARKLLGLLDEEGIDAVIAGGFVRDYLLGGEPRDIDLYISCKHFDRAYKLLREADYDSMTEDQVTFFSARTDEYEHQMIQMQAEFEGGARFKEDYPALAHMPINLIGLRNDTTAWVEIDGPEIIDKFNMSLSQVYIQLGIGDIIGYGPLVVESMKNRENMVLRETWGIDGTIKAVNKFRVKYPEWLVVMKDGTLYTEDKLRATQE